MVDRTLEDAEKELAEANTALKAGQAKQKRVAYSGVTKALGNREVEVVITTEAEDRDKDVVLTSGIGLGNYNKNPVVLFQHDASSPIARTVRLDLMAGKMVAVARFPEKGEVEDSDEIYGLIKAEVINTASIGFIPKEWEPRNKEVPWGGQIYKKCELLEWSFVSIPANPEAVIIGRSFDMVQGKFFTWAEEGGLRVGDVSEAGESEVVLRLWQHVDGQFKPSEELKRFAAEEAATALAPFKGFDAPDTPKEDSPCAGDENSRMTEARLRAVKALRLWSI